MKNMWFRGCGLLCLILHLFVVGCAGTSPPSKFYTLHSEGISGPTESFPSSSHALAISIGPVEIPDYLDRPEIVSRTNQNQLTLAEFDRWAGSLKVDITRVLSENLSLLLSKSMVSVTPWESGGPSDYRITVYITRFDILSEGYVLMNAQWNIIGKDGSTVLLTGKSSANEPVTAETYSARVASMSRALGTLSRDIAEGIKSVSRKSFT